MDTKRKSGLNVKMFGSFDMQYKGHSIFLNKHCTVKLNSLLQYFIVNKNKKCSPSSIVEALWPDNEYYDEKKVLQTYVYRLRNAFSKENIFKRDFTDDITILNCDGCYVMKISDDIEFDTDNFSHLANITDQLCSGEELINSALRLMEIYDGHYLQSSDHEHLVIRQRNHYLQIYCNAMAKILLRLSKLELYSDVVRICEGFFTADDTDEAINLIFLKALIKTKQINYAIRHYNYISQKMQDSLGIAPSAEISDLFHDINSGQEESDLPPKESDRVDLDENRIKNMIYQITAEKLASQNPTYTVAHIGISSSDTNEPSKDLLERLILNTLRKNDMYTIINNRTAVALLYEIKNEAYDVVKERIMEYAKHLGCGKDMKLKVTIQPTLSII